MQKKRSKGVIILSIWMFFVAFISLISSFISSPTQHQSVYKYKTVREVYLESAFENLTEAAKSYEKAGKPTGPLRDYLRELKELEDDPFLSRKPVPRFASFYYGPLQIMLGFAHFLAGILLLKLHRKSLLASIIAILFMWVAWILRMADWLWLHIELSRYIQKLKNLMDTLVPGFTKTLPPPLPLSDEKLIISWVLNFLTLALYTFIVYYFLTRPKVKEQFKQGQPTP